MGDILAVYDADGIDDAEAGESCESASGQSTSAVLNEEDESLSAGSSRSRSMNSPLRS